MKCLNCGTEIQQTPKKKQKIFCNSTCRSNYWQKSDRLEKQGFTADQIIKKIEESWKPKKIELVPKKQEPEKNEPKSKDNVSEFWKKRMTQKLGIK